MDHPRSRGVYPRSGQPGRMSEGSSPLARGLLGGVGRHSRRPGIIPARAGFTLAASRVASPSAGSSPLARGLRAAILIEAVGEGIIPARAGFTPAGDRAVGPVEDHPRSRGVYLHKATEDFVNDGSSPLARGLPRERADRRDPHRIIPARAGFTPSRPAGTPPPGDHPRSRGVYTVTGPAMRSSAGSSPLARGLPRSAPTPPPRRRIIPARAGFTASSAMASISWWDHPRSRGVYGQSPSPRWRRRGSSPLARGLRRRVVAGGQHPRIIPARAGFTAARDRGRGQLPDHPRSRGVYAQPWPPRRRRRGSSPLARGLLAILCGECSAWRIIPARAGFTARRGARRRHD